MNVLGFSFGVVAYQEFLVLWKDADLDIPILKQAKAECPLTFQTYRSVQQHDKRVDELSSLSWEELRELLKPPINRGMSPQVVSCLLKLRESDLPPLALFIPVRSRWFRGG